ncbi:hypothetical protein ACQ4PT_046255 [Festuca glaucescens]
MASRKGTWVSTVSHQAGSAQLPHSGRLRLQRERELTSAGTPRRGGRGATIGGAAEAAARARAWMLPDSVRGEAADGAAALLLDDRLSDLPDGVLGIILSFLPTKEAARAAALARSWRRTFAGIDTISFMQREAYDNNNYTFMKEALERRSRNGDFIDEVNAALLFRRRCGSHVAPRAFTVNFGCYHHWDGAMLDRWLFYVLGRSAQELHLDLRLEHALVGERYVNEPRYRDDADSDADFPASNECNAYGYDAHEYNLPRRLFSCVAIRTLCLGACSLEPPELIALPSLETLVLSSIRRLGSNIQRLVSSCPRLIDLTLERCGRNPNASQSLLLTKVLSF